MRLSPWVSDAKANVPPLFCDFCGWLGVALTEGQRSLATELYDAPGRASVCAVVAGARAGKSYILVALRLLHGALTRDLTSMAPGQRAVALVIAPSDVHRTEVVGYALGACESKVELRRLLGPRPSTTGFELRRDDGHTVAFEGGVATRGGYGGRGRSLTDFALDETAFFRDSSAKVNDVEIYRGGSPRVLPGGQTIVVSTPWAEKGLLYDLWSRNRLGRVDAHAVRAPTLELRPDQAEIVSRETLRDPENARREFGAEFLTSGTTLFFPRVLLESCIDDELVDGEAAEPHDVVCAGLDMGFRSDSSALVITHQRGAELRVAEILELRPEDGVPLKPSLVCEQFAERIRAHGGKYAVGDAHYREAVVEYLSSAGLYYADAPTHPADAYVRARQLMREGRVRLPRNERLLQQLSEVEGRSTSGGRMSITLPRWSSGGHCDIVSALVLALWQMAGQSIPEPVPAEGTSAWEESQREARADRAREQRQQGWRLGWKR